MARNVRDVMTRNVVTLPRTAPLRGAARRMKESDIGDLAIELDEHPGLAEISAAEGSH